MKKIFLFCLLCISLGILGQNNYTWEKSDTIPKSKSELYAITKVFINSYWKKDHFEILRDDLEEGHLFMNASTTTSFKFLMGTYTYSYDFQVHFQIKENVYLLTIDSLQCSKATFKGADGFVKSTTKIEPFLGENCPESSNILNPVPPKKKLIPMMATLMASLQAVMEDYSQNLNKTVHKKSNY